MLRFEGGKASVRRRMARLTGGEACSRVLSGLWERSLPMRSDAATWKEEVCNGSEAATDIPTLLSLRSPI